MTEQNTQNTQNAPQPELTFEAALNRLESIVYNLENGSLPLEESLAQFDEGMRLSKICGDKLAEAGNKIEMLMKKTDGSLGWVEYGRPQQQPPQQPQNQ